jgi:hypothetical protein
MTNSYNTVSSFYKHVEDSIVFPEGVLLFFDANGKFQTPCIIFDHQYDQPSAVPFISQAILVVSIHSTSKREVEDIKKTFYDALKLEYSGIQLDIKDFLTDYLNPTPIGNKYRVEEHAKPRFEKANSLPNLEKAEFEIKLTFSEI